MDYHRIDPGPTAYVKGTISLGYASTADLLLNCITEDADTPEPLTWSFTVDNRRTVLLFKLQWFKVIILFFKYFFLKSKSNLLNFNVPV